HGRRRRPLDGSDGGLMRTHGKKFRAAAEKVNRDTTYQARQAIDLVKSASFAKFDETVEVAVRLGVDPRHADQVVRGTVVLPAGTGKSVRVLVIAAGDKQREAEAAGADFVGTEYIQRIKDGFLDFDVMRAVRETKAGKIEFRVDKGGNIHAPIGKVSFPIESLETNFTALMDQLVRAKPTAAKGVYIRNVAVSSTMGPGLSVDT